MEPKPCAIRKCTQPPDWALLCRAYDSDGVLKMKLGTQYFCFWHYADLGMEKLHIRDFWAYTGKGKDNLIVRAVQ